MGTASFRDTTEYPLVNVSIPASTRIELGVSPIQVVFYEDVNPEYSSKGDRALLRDADAIKAQIRLILATPLGSEVFEPDFGSMLPYRLFEPINAMTAWQIENDTITAVSKWMKDRISLSRNNCRVEEYSDPGSGIDGYRIILQYSILRTKEVNRYAIKVSR